MKFSHAGIISIIAVLCPASGSAQSPQVITRQAAGDQLRSQQHLRYLQRGFEDQEHRSGHRATPFPPEFFAFTDDQQLHSLHNYYDQQRRDERALNSGQRDPAATLRAEPAPAVSAPTAQRSLFAPPAPRREVQSASDEPEGDHTALLRMNQRLAASERAISSAFTRGELPKQDVLKEREELLEQRARIAEKLGISKFGTQAGAQTDERIRHLNTEISEWDRVMNQDVLRGEYLTAATKARQISARELSDLQRERASTGQ